MISDLDLCNASPSPEFDAVTALVARLLKAPTSFVSFLDDRAGLHIYKSHVGLSEPLASTRMAPLENSMCHEVRATGRLLAIEDARRDGRYHAYEPVTSGRLVAYLGAPITGPDGTAVGTLCAVDRKARTWSADDAETITVLAASISAQLQARALARRAERETKAREAFFAHLCHEIRTPLGGMISLADMLAADLEPESRRRELADLILNAGEALLAMLNDTLDLARAQAEAVETVREPFVVAELLTCVTALERARASKKGVGFDLTVGEGLAAPRLGDEARLRQVLHNLISNATKFTEAGTVAVSAQMERDALTIAVSDTGIGIPLERQEAIFEAFIQAESDTCQRFGGTGLGLPIARRLVEAMGGTLTLKSGAGEGSTFTIRLPCPLASSSSSSAAAAAAQLTHGATTRMLTPDNRTTAAG
ncbi:MAG: ATP-binding protein [Pseudomonadota bacterium]